MAETVARAVDLRLMGLRRFAIAITVLNILGHFWFGFEQSWAQLFVALTTAYSAELLLETVEALAAKRQPKFLAGPRAFVDFLLPAHITGLAVGMLLYANDRLAVLAFASAVAIGFKALVSRPGSGGKRHIMNPSNFGITVTLLSFSWVGIAPPYHFTENLNGTMRWVLPLIIIASGSFLNIKLTKRAPLIISWLTTFFLQALIRHLVTDCSLVGALRPMTGVAFVLFTFYMVTDPGTTPQSKAGQIAFVASVAGAYAVLISLHIVFGLFFALTIVCALRGLLTFAFLRASLPISVPEKSVNVYVLQDQRI